MNKYILKAVLCSALVAPMLTSCELDQFPETSLPTEKSWAYVSDATNYNTGLLAMLRSTCTAGRTVSEIQSDLFNLRTTGTAAMQYHNWRFTTAQADGDATWTSNYGTISNANNIINNIDKVVVEEGSEDEALLKQYKATAYFARAYCYANMVTRFCKNYEPETAKTPLGLPLVTVVDVNAKPSRASLEKTYELICGDIDQALALFEDKTNTDYSEPNYYVAKALQARVFLQMKKYPEAVEAAKEVMAKYPLSEDKAAFKSMWTEDIGSEIIYEPQQTIDERSTMYSAYISYSTQQDIFNPEYLPTQGLMDLYESKDWRRSLFFGKTGAAAGDVVDENAYIMTKFPGNEELKQTSEYDFYNMTKAFRVAEMYLIAAEAQYRIDGTGADFLNALRTNRKASEKKLTGAALFAEIKNEWAREMCGEGFRLECLKRWGDPCKRMEPQPLAAGFLITNDGFTNLSKPADDFHWVWEIPSQDLQANPNLERNWPSEK